MNFPKANSFPTSVMRERSMGPNPLDHLNTIAVRLRRR